MYVPGVAATRANPIDWMTRDGKTSVLRPTKADWANPRFSPDGQKLALDISDGKQSDIWVYEWARDRLTQLTFDQAQRSWPGLDARRPAHRVCVRSRQGRRQQCVLGERRRHRRGHAADRQPVRTRCGTSWHPSGKFVAFMEQARRHRLGPDDPADGGRCGARVDARQAHGLSEHAGSQGAPTFSPDGRWIAYVSNEAGGNVFDVYVRPFPGPGGAVARRPRRAAAIRGGRPRRANCCSSRVANVMAAPYTVVGDSFRADTPQLWSPTNIRGAALSWRVRPPPRRQAGRDGLRPRMQGRRPSGQGRVRLQFLRLPAQDRAGDQIERQVAQNRSDCLLASKASVASALVTSGSFGAPPCGRSACLTCRRPRPASR